MKIKKKETSETKSSVQCYWLESMALFLKLFYKENRKHSILVCWGENKQKRNVSNGCWMLTLVSTDRPIIVESCSSVGQPTSDL